MQFLTDLKKAAKGAREDEAATVVDALWKVMSGYRRAVTVPLKISSLRQGFLAV